MTAAILLLLFLVITCSFGYLITYFILREKRLFALIPLSVILGVGAFNFFVNILSYAIPVQKSPWVVLMVMVLASATLLAKKGKPQAEAGLESRQSKILFIVAIVITLLSGTVALKSLALDDLFIGHSALSVTIANGNFPVVDPSAPTHPLSYHYGPELLSASLKIITGIPVWFGYDIQIFLFSGTLFLLLFVLLFDITRRFKISIIGAALFLYGTGLQWIYLFTKGLPVFWTRFIEQEPVPAFWQFLTSVAFPRLNTSYLFIMNNHSMALGMPILVLALLFYFRSLKATSRREFLIYIIFGAVSYGYLALNLETYWVIMFLSLICMLVVYACNKKWEAIGRVFTSITSPRFLSSTLILMALGLGIALIQGGILASMFKDTDRDRIVPVESFQDFITLNYAPNPAQVDNRHTYITMFSPEFFIQFGMPLILIIPAIIYFYRRRNGTILHLFIIALGSFLVPLLFRWPSRPWEMSRFFSLALPLFALISGTWLAEIYDGSRKKKLIATGIILIGLTGLISQGIFTISNLDRFGQVGPLIAYPPTPSAIDEKAFTWIATSTTMQDYFFPYDHEFIRFTSRYTPGVFPYFTFTRREAEKAYYDSIVNGCSRKGIEALGIKYLYISPQFPIKNYKECVARLGAQEVYSDIRKDDFRVIYTIE